MDRRIIGPSPFYGSVNTPAVPYPTVKCEQPEKPRKLVKRGKWSQGTSFSINAAGNGDPIILNSEWGRGDNHSEIPVCPTGINARSLCLKVARRGFLSLHSCVKGEMQPLFYAMGPS
jgi:hypothetical protein